MEAASAVSEHCKMLLEEQRVKSNKLDHQLSLAQQEMEELATEHNAALKLVENQKEKIVQQQSDILCLQQEVQARSPFQS